MNDTPPSAGQGENRHLSPVELRLQSILADVDFPAISTEALEALHQVPDSETSIQRLANIVLREYALTVKVLRTANSAHYRRSEKHIKSAAHAMLLLGAGTVRNLAGSLLLFEHYRTRSPGLKELMLLSLLTANHARELAMRRNLPDPEEANLCGMFRDLGEVLVAAYFARDYARILQHMEQRRTGPAVAAFEVVGFRFEELGEAMARNWGMPESVCGAIRSASAQSSNDLFVITAFAHELTAAVYRREADATRDSVAEVLARYARRLKLTRDEVGEVLEAALRETKVIFASANVSLDGLTLRRQQRAALVALGTGGHDAVEGEDAHGADVQPAEVGIGALREDLRSEVSRLASPASGEELSKVILMTLEAAFRGGPFTRVVLCLISPDHHMLNARYGLGDGVESGLDGFSCELDSRSSPIALALNPPRSIAVPTERAFSPGELRFARTVGAASFLVVPLVVDDKPLGSLYCDRNAAAPPPDASTIAFVRSLCDGVLSGIAARRAADATGSVAPTAEFKRDAVLRLFAGETSEVVGASLGVAVSALELWRREFLEGAMTKLSQG